MTEQPRDEDHDSDERSAMGRRYYSSTECRKKEAVLIKTGAKGFLCLTRTSNERHRNEEKSARAFFVNPLEMGGVKGQSQNAFRAFVRIITISVFKVCFSE